MEQIFNDFFSTIHLPHHTTVLNEGEIANKVFLIKKGCMRLFFYHEGKDITFQFFFENDYVASFDSLITHSPSSFYLETLENTEALYISSTDFLNIIKGNEKAHLLYENFLVNRFHEYQQLFLSRIRDTPQKRYQLLLREHPEIIKRVPQHYIASYLGITPVSLSRIRSRY